MNPPQPSLPSPQKQSLKEILDGLSSAIALNHTGGKKLTGYNSLRKMDDKRVAEAKQAIEALILQERIDTVDAIRVKVNRHYQEIFERDGKYDSAVLDIILDYRDEVKATMETKK